ncbi:ferric reductase transmembrane component 4 [Kwoniella heveanensis CBS 569]|nr:ferric reductase transmembrane component 4 [Kwoniella heveanensis CBS 569]
MADQNHDRNQQQVFAMADPDPTTSGAIESGPSSSPSTSTSIYSSTALAQESYPYSYIASSSSSSSSSSTATSSGVLSPSHGNVTREMEEEWARQRAISRKVKHDAMRNAWIWIGATFLLLVLMHLYRQIKHSRRRRRAIRAYDDSQAYKPVSTAHDDLADDVDEDDEPDTNGNEGPGEGEGEDEQLVIGLGRSRAGQSRQSPQIISGKERGRVRRLITGIGATYRNTVYLRSFPWWLYGPETVMDALFTIVYTVVYGYLCVAKTEVWFPTKHNTTANQLGVMSFSQLPIILLLVSKNNPISNLTGITYQKLNYLHRASSRVCLFTSWLHALLWTPKVWSAGDTRPYLLFGIAALTGFTMLWVTSFRIIRRMAYEFFLVSHILFSLLYLIGAFFHWWRMWYWVAPAMAIWALDRFIRFAKVMYQNNFHKPNRWKNLGESKIELLDHDVMRVSIRRDNFHWKAGQHGFISSPSISSSPHESHPFSIANVPTESSNEAVFLIRVHSGFTKRMRTALSSDQSNSIPLYLEGPYGYAHNLDSYSTVLLVSGGTGVTFVLGHFLQILASVRAGTSAVKKLHLVWHIRHAEDIEWIASLLNQGLLDPPDSMNIVIDVFVTKSHASDEPWPPEMDLNLTETLHHEIPRLLHLRNEDNYNNNRGSWDEGCRTCSPNTPMTESRDENLFLPKRATILGRYGLMADAAEKIRWRRGRADLKKIVEEDAGACVGCMNVSVCGPTQLLHATKKAVREASNYESSMRGLPSIDFFEETLGA